jgi:hypothetical protein
VMVLPVGQRVQKEPSWSVQFLVKFLSPALPVWKWWSKSPNHSEGRNVGHLSASNHAAENSKH